MGVCDLLVWSRNCDKICTFTCTLNYGFCHVNIVIDVWVTDLGYAIVNQFIPYWCISPRMPINQSCTLSEYYESACISHHWWQKWKYNAHVNVLNMRWQYFCYSSITECGALFILTILPDMTYKYFKGPYRWVCTFEPNTHNPHTRYVADSHFLR